jgi:UDP-N-acetylmuramate: L-alanyl-gamma-D-glutamyl-meso-diaminopimelate ligase
VAAARALGLEFGEIARGFATFAGVRRRQEVRGEAGGVLVVDDFAHHPTAVRLTIAGIRARFPGRRLWAVFEPRSNTSRRRLHQDEYVNALASAQCVALKVPEGSMPGPRPTSTRWSTPWPPTSAPATSSS